MSHTVDGWLEMTYKYNADGVRTHKTAYDLDVDDYTEHEYILNGTQIVAEIIDNYTTLIYLYDENGAPIGMKYRTAAYAAGVFDTFFFEKNLQGDVIAVYDSNGTKLISYTYDAWGNFRTTYVTTGTTALGKAIRNPFKYRGYYYDNDTGWYYLQTRYYNPVWGRFINADSIMSGADESLKGNNLYVYCFNNPISYDDSFGNWPKLIEEVIATVKKNIGKVGSIINNILEDASNFDYYNESEEKTLASNYFSAYKGQIVIREDWGFTNGRSGSFGIMFLNSNEKEINAVRHEYGHFVQLKLLGIYGYVRYVAIPSILSGYDYKNAELGRSFIGDTIIRVFKDLYFTIL